MLLRKQKENRSYKLRLELAQFENVNNLNLNILLNSFEQLNYNLIEIIICCRNFVN